jgi:hypothetical protein
MTFARIDVGPVAMFAALVVVAALLVAVVGLVAASHHESNSVPRGCVLEPITLGVFCGSPEALDAFQARVTAGVFAHRPSLKDDKQQ